MTITRPASREPIVNTDGTATKSWWRFFEGVFQAQGGGDGLISAGFIQTGMIINFGGSETLDFYLLCDGTGHFVADFPDLFDVIGFSFGGSGLSFLVPDITPANGITIIKT